MGPASTINHAFSKHLLPIFPLPGIDRCRGAQFMTLALKELTFPPRTQDVNPLNYLNSWLCMFKYRMGDRAIKEFQRQERSSKVMR